MAAKHVAAGDLDFTREYLDQHFDVVFLSFFSSNTWVHVLLILLVYI